MKNRLTQLLLNLPTSKKYVDGVCVGKQLHTAESIADYLLSEGVVVPPVKMGQTVYAAITPIFEDDPENGEVYEWTVKGIAYEGDGKWWIESEDDEWYEPGCVVESAVKYVADFVYKTADGKTVVEDVKGRRTKDYIIKRKLMLYIHNIKIREIT